MSLSSTLPLDNRLLSEILALSRDATAIYSGEDIIIRMANDKMIRFWGKISDVIGLHLAAALPEPEQQEFIAMIRNVWYTGNVYHAVEKPVLRQVNGRIETFYFDITCRALKDDNSNVFCIIHTVTDVTPRVKLHLTLKEKEHERFLLNEKLAVSYNDLSQANKELTEMQEQMSGLHTRLADSEALFKNIFAQAPLGLTWLRGPEMIIEEVNDPILKIWGRTAPEVLGKPIRKARPELEGQTILDRLHRVYSTGIIEVNAEYRVLLKDGDGLREAYVNSVYSPLRDSASKNTGHTGDHR